MKKAKVTVKLLKKYRTDIVYNNITRAEYLIDLEGYFYKYSTPIEINGIKYNKEYIKDMIILDILENLLIFKEFNNFGTPQDIQDFSEMFGYEKIKDLLEVIDTIRKIAEKVSFINNTKYLKKMRELHSDGDPEKIKESRKEIRKFFIIENEK